MVGDALVVEIARFKGDGVVLELRDKPELTGTWRLLSANAAAARPTKVEMTDGRLRLSPSGFANAERWELARVEPSTPSKLK